MIVNVNTLLNYARHVSITSYARLMQTQILLSSFHNEMLISCLLLTAEFIADTVCRKCSRWI